MLLVKTGRRMQASDVLEQADPMFVSPGIVALEKRDYELAGSREDVLKFSFVSIHSIYLSWITLVIRYSVLLIA